MKNLYLLPPLLILLLNIAAVQSCGRGSIKIENNGYKDILIAIADEVPESPELIDRIKEVFTDASAFLYRITRERAFFEQITILVPEQWERPYLPATQETYDKSDIVIDLPFRDNNQPFTVKSTPCGDFGYFIRLTTEYLMNDQVAEFYGPYEKVILHEWSHLRYGVFDEYSKDNAFYATMRGEIQATRCGSELTGDMINPETGGKCRYFGNFPVGECVYQDNILEGNGYSSLMYKTYLDHITEFCDSNSDNAKTFHNKQATNLQNKLCGRRSIWDVLEDHPDFNQNNPPREIGDTTPEFNIVKPGVHRTVLVLDVSGSMDGCKIDLLGQACSNYISNIIEDGEYLGIVWFNDSPTAQQELTLINYITRVATLYNIPTIAGGGTSIGGGIREALQMLKRYNPSLLGGTLIVMSDGDEMDPPYVADVADEVFDAFVTVNSIAITDNADSAVDELAAATGGLTYLFSDCATSNGMNDAFIAIGEMNTSPTNRSYVLKSTVESVTSLIPMQGALYVDNTLGRNTQFIFDYDYNAGDITPSITSPSGKVYDKTSTQVFVHDTTFGIYRFTIPDDEFQSGLWEYTVYGSSTSWTRVALTIKSQSAVVGQYPILANVFWGMKNVASIGPGGNNPLQTIYVSVSKGYEPVLNADVEVSIVRPTGDTVNFKVYDSGAGADATDGDGVYSEYFIQYNSAGRYSVQVSVNSKATTVVNPDGNIGSGAAAINQDSDSLEPVDNFTRSDSGGSFELASYSDPGSQKLYSPGTVIDLQVLAGHYENQTIVLTWTAVGDQLNFGQVSAYDLRMATDFESIEYSFENQTRVTDDAVINNRSLSDPQPAGTKETFVIEAPSRGEVTYFFAIKAVDMDGRYETGEMSNIAAVSMADLNDTGLSAGAIAGILLAVAFLAVVLVGLVVMAQKNRTSKSMDDEHSFKNKVNAIA